MKNKSESNNISPQQLQQKLDAQNHELFYLKTIVQKIPGYVYWKNRDGVYLGCNEQLRDSVDVEIIGKTDSELPWKEFAERIRGVDLQVLETGQPIEVEEFTTLGHSKNIWILTKKNPLKDQEGNIVGILGISMDITARKKLEMELEISKRQEKEANQAKNLFLQQMSKEVIGQSFKNQTAEENAVAVRHHLESIIACMPGNVFWTDRNSIYLGCNDNVLDTFGLKSRSDFVGMTYEKLAQIGNWTEGQGESFRHDDQEVMRTGMPKLNVEEPAMPDANGEVHYFLTSRVPLRNDQNEVTGIVGISIDITERKKMEEELRRAKIAAEAADKAKTEFMENMSHDFKTPLNGIYGVVQILKMRDELPDDVKELINGQEKSVLRLKNLVEYILDFDKLNSGKLQILEEPLNLFEIIESIIDNVAHQTKSKNITINLAYPSDVPRHLLSDSRCVTSIMLNLISNAIKFTDHGGVSIAVKTISQEQDNIILQISVADTGIGIPENKKEQIFERFNRLEPSNKGLREGHGIGLAIVKELTNNLNGSIKVESELGKGSTFIITLPFKI